MYIDALILLHTQIILQIKVFLDRAEEIILLSKVRLQILDDI